MNAKGMFDIGADFKLTLKKDLVLKGHFSVTLTAFGKPGKNASEVVIRCHHF